MNINDMTFKDVANLTIPSEVLFQGIRRVATYKKLIPNRGVVMGEGPDYWILVLNNGMVFEWGSWEEVSSAQMISYQERNQGDLIF